jgi:hypothetical protein
MGASLLQPEWRAKSSHDAYLSLFQRLRYAPRPCKTIRETLCGCLNQDWRRV